MSQTQSSFVLKEAIPTSSSSMVTDLNTFLIYLKRIISVLLDESGEAPNELEQALLDAKNLKLIKNFLSDVHIKCMLVTKKEENYDEDCTLISFSFSNQITYSDSKSIGIAFLKCGSIVDASKSIQSQLRLISLDTSNDNTPYETIHAYITNAVSPYFKSYISKMHLDSA